MSRIEEAFSAVNRSDFVLPEYHDQAGLDVPLSIGYGQTISQPTTVRAMLEWLGPQPGDKVLDVGSGSGWTTALLSYLVGENGSVYAVEKIPELLKLGESNVRRAEVTNATFYPAGNTFGLPEHAPYDRILVSAAADWLPQELIDQLKIGGRMVIPIQNSIHTITKTAKDRFDEQVHPGFIFVPLV